MTLDMLAHYSRCLVVRARHFSRERSCCRFSSIGFCMPELCYTSWPRAATARMVRMVRCAIKMERNSRAKKRRTLESKGGGGVGGYGCKDARTKANVTFERG